MSIDSSVSRENPDDERINIPANANHYWRYRMHISLDDLLKMTVLNSKIKELAKR